ncbi:MAG: cytochrome c3 family protein [Geobacteraceae bacterium]|nr:cytochrome c3 family protein [Geobacteraceae bacterium]
MLRTISRLIPALCLFLWLPQSTFAERGMAIDPAVCLGCHGDKVPAAAFAASVHGKNACTSCHVAVTDLARHIRGEVKPEKVTCVRCHKEESAEHYASVHMLHGIACSDCHSDIHTQSYWAKDKRLVVAACLRCHAGEGGFLASVHGRGVAAGNPDAAACNDCHNLHEIKSLDKAGSFGEREFHTRVCLRCHADERMMRRNNVFTVAVKSYMESYHGKNFRLGYPERVAGCTDCHTAHEILSAADPRSSVTPANLVRTCGRCHSGATPLFVRFYPHGEHTDRKNYPILFWTFVAMTALLGSVFGVFWAHTLLWMARGFVENREKLAALHEGRLKIVVTDGFTQYNRFNRKHIFLHLVVIISFLGLSLTGLPLKFSSQEWARLLMHLYGGTANAGLIHRICAGMTFLYFAAAIAMSIHFLFLRRDVPGNWLQRLLGPDSLCPNLRDLRDAAKMFRWFLHMGEKPTFERWTYWEKFDFLAVFWGMFIIGGSGLMLWFPQFFGQFLPGWMFNVATIVHSDEALLATGFIFTVHFFNTHGRPEKFPMDFVIFNGQISKYEFIEERGDQWRRYEEAGITERFKTGKTSGVIYDFLFKGFGFLSLFAGIILLLLILYAFITSG